MKFGTCTIGPAVSEEKSSESVDKRRMDDGAWLSNKLPQSLQLRWAKILALKDHEQNLSKLQEQELH